MSTKPKEPMTVGQLIEALEIYDLDLRVITEGCDCDGIAGSVSQKEDNDGKYVYISRTDLY